MVKTKTLLLIAGIVWLIAGFNILRIGVISYQGYVTFLNLFLSVIIFLCFWIMVFRKLVNKHTTRITNYTEPKKYFWSFFDIPSFMIMAFMITLGVTIRSFNLLPDVVIAVFYSGLGSAIFLAGVNFTVNYFIHR